MYLFVGWVWMGFWVGSYLPFFGFLGEKLAGNLRVEKCGEIEWVYCMPECFLREWVFFAGVLA